MADVSVDDPVPPPLDDEEDEDEEEEGMEEGESGGGGKRRRVKDGGRARGGGWWIGWKRRVFRGWEEEEGSGGECHQAGRMVVSLLVLSTAVLRSR